MDLTIPFIIIQLIFLEGILSIDNAAVLGAMVSHLPADKPIPMGHPESRASRLINKILGPQRGAALRVGLLGAYAGRGLMLVLASLVVHNPWLKLIGAAYLIRLAFENLGAAEAEDEDGSLHKINATSFWQVVLTVELTDLIFSLDNVVAAVSLSDKLWVVMVGVAIGILMMRFAAGWFSYAVSREPILKTAAYILVLNIGIELFVSELAGFEINDWLRFGISVATILISLLYAHSRLLQKLRPVLLWLAQGFAAINALVDWALVPLGAAFRLLATGIRRIGSLFPAPVKE
jgi:tellurite resistance protein TerC